MRYLIARLCLLFLLCKTTTSCSNKNIDCSEFKTGSFVFHNAFTGTDILINRTDSIQTSVDKKTGMGNKCSIQWIGTCKYELTFLSFIIDGKDSLFDNSRTWKGTTEIVKATNNYYISDTKLEGEQGIHRDTLWLLSK